MKKVFLNVCKMHEAAIFSVIVLTLVTIFCIIIVPIISESKHQSKIEQIIKQQNSGADDEQIINTLINMENEKYAAEKEAGTHVMIFLAVIVIGGPLAIFLWILQEVLYKTWRIWYEKHY